MAKNAIWREALTLPLDAFFSIWAQPCRGSWRGVFFQIAKIAIWGGALKKK